MEGFFKAVHGKNVVDLDEPRKRVKNFLWRWMLLVGM